MKQINLSNEFIAYSKFYGFVRLARMFEVSLAASTVFLGLVLLEIDEIRIYFFSFFAIWFGGLSINSWNDSLDITEDSISHPDRPIPLGVFSIYQARIIGIISFILSLLSMYLVSSKALLLLFVSVSVGIIYSLTTKRFLLMKNFTVAITAFFVLIALPWSLGKTTNILTFSFAFSVAIILFGYEILKDIHDVKGDEQAGISTIPLKYSANVAAFTAGILFVLSCLVMAIGFALLNMISEAIISGTTSILVSFPLFWLKNAPTPENSDLARYSVILLLSISLGLIGFLQIQQIFNL